MSLDISPTTILDKSALQANLRKATSPVTHNNNRGDALAIYKKFLTKGRLTLQRSMNEGASGASLVLGYSFLVDEILQTICNQASLVLYTEPNPTVGAKLTLVATGGYGRAELAPWSDIDLLFLHPWKLTARNEQVVEYVLYTLWDLGLKVGHATRSVTDCLSRAKKDITIRTSLLESRFLWGHQGLYKDFSLRFWNEVVTGTESLFVSSKLAERDARHHRTGDSRYLLEPNIKDGKGGLRDLHTLFWIAKYLYNVDQFSDLVGLGLISPREQTKFSNAENFLWKVRAHLHILSGRPEDRLSFDVQPEIACHIGYADRNGNLAVERFMKHYFLIAKSVGELTRVLCASLEADSIEVAPRRVGAFGPSPTIDCIKTDKGRLAVVHDLAFDEKPARLLRLFRLAQTSGLDIHPRTLRLVHQCLRLINQNLRDNVEANEIFFQILTYHQEPDITLRQMSESGVLGRFIPEFGQIIGQVQFDMYHVYTVDEHTIQAISILSQIERGELRYELPLATEIISNVISRQVLYLSLFCHDLAKGKTNNHSETGAIIAKNLGLRLGLSDEQSEQTAWLVRNHLILSKSAFKRDINDPQTLTDFITKVTSLERLKLLFIFTLTDIKAVGPGRLNGWKNTLLTKLYHRAEEILSGGHQAHDMNERVIISKTLLRRNLKTWSEKNITEYTDKLSNPYWLAFDNNTHLQHAKLIRNSCNNSATFEIQMQNNQLHAATEITVFTKDKPGLIASMAGAIASAGADIVDAKAFTTNDGMALDSFWVQDAKGDPFDEHERLIIALNYVRKGFHNKIVQDLTSRQARLVSKREDYINIVPEVIINNRASNQHTLIEVNGRDRPGLLFNICQTLTDLGISIVTAHISTYGIQAVDVFYVKNKYGMQLTKKAEILKVRTCLLEALNKNTKINLIIKYAQKKLEEIS